MSLCNTKCLSARKKRLRRSGIKYGLNMRSIFHCEAISRNAFAFHSPYVNFIEKTQKAEKGCRLRSFKCEARERTQTYVTAVEARKKGVPIQVFSKKFYKKYKTALWRAPYI